MHRECSGGWGGGERFTHFHFDTYYVPLSIQLTLLYQVKCLGVIGIFIRKGTVCFKSSSAVSFCSWCGPNIRELLDLSWAHFASLCTITPAQQKWACVDVAGHAARGITLNPCSSYLDVWCTLSSAYEPMPVSASIETCGTYYSRNIFEQWHGRSFALPGATVESVLCITGSHDYNWVTWF